MRTREVVAALGVVQPQSRSSNSAAFTSSFAMTLPVEKERATSVQALPSPAAQARFCAANSDETD